MAADADPGFAVVMPSPPPKLVGLFARAGPAPSADERANTKRSVVVFM
jgi:hypothetical protein